MFRAVSQEQGAFQFTVAYVQEYVWYVMYKCKYKYICILYVYKASTCLLMVTCHVVKKTSNLQHILGYASTQKTLNQTRQSRQFIKIGATSDFFPNDFLTKKSPQVLKYISKNSQAPVLFPHLHAHFTTHFPRNSTQLSSQLNQPFSARHNK